MSASIVYSVVRDTLERTTRLFELLAAVYTVFFLYLLLSVDATNTDLFFPPIIGSATLWGVLYTVRSRLV